MKNLAGLSGGQTLGLAGVALAAALASGLYLSGTLSETIDQAETTSPPTPVSQTPLQEPEEQEIVAETVSTPDPVAQATPDLPDLPKVSTFLLDPDGRMVVAGRTSPGWETAIRLNSEELSRFMPEGNGDFVEFVTVAPSDAPRVLTLTMTSPEDGQDVVSKGEIIIAPLRAPQPEPQEAESDTATDIAATTAPDSPEAPPATETQVTATAQPVSEPATPAAVLMNDAEGLRVVQPAPSTDPAPEVMATVALDAISYSDKGDVLLAGRGTRDGFVRVYLDNSPITTSRIAEDGKWRSELPEIDTGVYTLRIDAVDADGTVTSRIETPFKRESDDVLSAATETNQPVQAVIVQPGYTLWGISRSNYGDGFQYVRIFEANRDRIRDPDLIYPGQLFSIPQD